MLTFLKNLDISFQCLYICVIDSPNTTTMKNRKLILVIGFAVTMAATITALSVAPMFIFISLPATLICGAILNKSVAAN